MNNLLGVIVESILLELSNDQQTRRLGGTVSNFLENKYGSGLEGMESSEFSKILSIAIRDIMRSKKVMDPEIAKQIARFVTIDLIKSGLRPNPNKKTAARPTAQTKKPAKQGLFSRLFSR